MSQFQSVLRALDVGGEPRSLVRPAGQRLAQVSPDTRKGDPLQPPGGHSPQPAETAGQGPTATGAVAAPAPSAQATYEEGYAQGRSEGGQAGYDQGYQQGMAHARQEAQEQVQQEVMERVQKEAAELAAAQVREALAAADENAQQQSREQQSRLARQHALLENLLQKVTIGLQTAVDDAEDDMLALAHDALCRLLGERAVDIDALRSQLHYSLRAWHGRAPLSLHLHPDDLELLQSDPPAQELLRAAGFSTDRSSLRWVADPRVSIGGYQLRSSEGALDARLEVQLEALKASLLRTRTSRKQAAASLPGEAPHG